MANSNPLPVILYSKPGCVMCTATKRWFDDHFKNYRIIDVTENQQAFAHLQEKGVKQMPAVEIPFEYEVAEPFFTGFNPGLLAQLL